MSQYEAPHLVAGAPAQMEFQREIDAMQLVYSQERRRLELLLRELQTELEELQGQLGPAREERLRPAFDKEAEAGLVPRLVCWRLENAGAMYAFRASDADPAHCSEECFRLKECPGVDFALRFFPMGGEPDAAGLRTQWRLTLQVSGAAAEGLRLAVGLAVGFSFVAGACPCPDLGFEAVMPMPESQELLGAGKVTRVGAWPPEEEPGMVAAIVCQASLTVRCWDAEPLVYETEWLPAPPGGSAPPLNSDSE